ncbi:hypothetical protein [Azomonas macrocytogenes]|uniref:Uncharacterized protein n=1 Tax=Azomonas macrocytogenes TaxID=69962 RepID=A0A839SZK5_AZOMA|nr:hypothetical protein [Azomonas macrocytogenes]MBB3101710.1 hypothetical protein [Azomonas macrocytogenes]
MKICAISPLCSTSESEILEFIRECEHDLVVLPGHARNHPGYRKIAKTLKPGISAFVEDGSGKGNTVPWLVSADRQVRMPSQIFGQKPTTNDIDSLQSAWPERTHNIHGHKVSFALCGEIDAFSKNGKVKGGRQLPYEILINPTHTTRGRWNHLGEKLRNLSVKSVVIHVANNNYDHHDVTTHLRIYVNGSILSRQITGGISWSWCEI